MLFSSKLHCLGSFKRPYWHHQKWLWRFHVPWLFHSKKTYMRAHLWRLHKPKLKNHKQNKLVPHTLQWQKVIPLTALVQRNCWIWSIPKAFDWSYQKILFWDQKIVDQLHKGWEDISHPGKPVKAGWLQDLKCRKTRATVAGG